MVIEGKNKKGKKRESFPRQKGGWGGRKGTFFRRFLFPPPSATGEAELRRVHGEALGL
jgi:hypothetical protein